MINPKNLPAQENPMTGSDSPDPARQFYSVGFVCGMIQQAPHFVLELMRHAGVEFDHYRDGVG
jgi:hypothetical protein